MQISNAGENDIKQDLSCVHLKIEKFINLTKSVCRDKFFFLILVKGRYCGSFNMQF